MTITERIKEKAKREGISIAELSRRSGVPDPTLRTMLHRNSDNVRVDTLKKLSSALNTSVEYLQGKTGDDSPRETNGFHADLFVKRLRSCMAEYNNRPDPEHGELPRLSAEDYSLYDRALADPAALTGSEIYRLAKSFDVNPMWLVGESDDKKYTGSWDQEELQYYGRTHSVEIEAQLNELKRVAIALCTDTRDLSYLQQLHQEALMPARIDMIIDFLKCNSRFLFHNMPGIPADLDPPDFKK